MNDSFAQWLQWIEAGTLASAIRESTWLYPFLEIIHIFGIVLVAGAASLFDLLLLFYYTNHSIQNTAFHLLTWSKRGLILVIPSGLLLFITNAAALAYDPTFHFKLILLLLAALNAWIFHVRVYMPYVNDTKIFNRKAGTTNAIVSLLIWMGVIACGRLLAY